MPTFEEYKKIFTQQEKPIATIAPTPTIDRKDPTFQKYHTHFTKEAEQLKTPKPKEFKINFMSWMDRLLRLNYASAGLAKEMFVPGEEFTPGQAIWKGLAGEEKTLYSDVLQTLGWQPTTKIGKFARGVTGFGLDVLLDPLTYIGLGTLTRGGRAVAKVGKLAPGIAQQAKLGQRALISFAGQPIVKGAPALQALGKTGMALRGVPGVEKLGKAFVPGFRPRGVDPNVWNKLQQIKRSATAIKRVGNEKAFKFATEVLDDMKKMISKGQLNDEGIKLLTESIERRGLVAGLPDSVRPIWQKLITYADDVTQRRAGIGKTLLDDTDYNYWLHSLSQTERDKLHKLGLDIGFRDWTTSSASDIQRKYLKFRDLGTGAIHIGKAKDLKALPMSFKGISKEHLGELFESTIRDLSDLQTVATQYGIKVRFTPKTMTRGRALGSWASTTRTFRVATGGHEQAEWLSTVAHELAHVIHGEFGALSALQSSRAILDASRKVILPSGKWRKIVDAITVLSEKHKERIYEALGYNMQDVLAKKSYYFKPTEVWARYIQLYKKNPLVAKALPGFGRVAEETRKLSPEALRIFGRTVEESTPYFKGIAGNIYRTKKGQLFESSQATINEINQALGRDFFSTDIPFTAYQMGRRLSRQESGTFFFKSVRELGTTEALEGLVKSTAPELKGLYFNPQITKEIDTIRKVFVSEELTQGFLQYFDTVQNFWKKWTLGPFPAYHFRNMIGNTWNNYLGGVSPTHMVEAGKIQLKHSRKQALTSWERKIIKRAEALGVLERGWFGTVLGTEGAPTLTKKAGKWAVKPAEAGLRVGRQIENNARLAHFIDKVRKGWSYDEAALSVKKYLFDYSELTPFEINVMRRLMPFYCWSRKNIPLQIEHILKKPGKTIAPVEKVRRGLAMGAEPERKYLPEWLQERMAFRVGKPEAGKARYFPLESWLPIADVGKLARPMQAFMELVTPAVKLPVELLMNKSFYFDKPIRRYPEERKKMLGIPLPAKAEYGLRTVRIFNELNRLLEKPKPTAFEATAIDKWVRVLTGIKLYPQRISEMKRWSKYRVDQQIFELKKGYNRARRNREWGEAQRINQTIKKLERIKFR